eukprot:200516-Rhodomonas_salina.1
MRFLVVLLQDGGSTSTTGPRCPRRPESGSTGSKSCRASSLVLFTALLTSCLVASRRWTVLQAGR